MRRWAALTLVSGLLVSLLLSGCGQSQPHPPQAGSGTSATSQASSDGSATPLAQSPSSPTAAGLGSGMTGSLPLIPLPEPSAQEKYDTALLDAINLMAERKLVEALAALEVARGHQDTEQVRREIARLKFMIERQAAAERTVQDIQAVLRDGKAEEASQLATTALHQFGGTETGESLAKLKRQADALVAAQVADQAARRDRFRREADAALRDKNLRAAAIALEQSLQGGDDPSLRQQLSQTRQLLTRYDEARQRGLELRKDPYQLEDAITALEDAAAAWETLQVRQELDECRLALQRRRDRVAVADFEVRGDVGIPYAGRTVAEELAPAFRSRFDVVERSQLNKIIAELKLEASDLAENDARREELGRLARVRYMVVGSITPMSGILVNARLVETRTGLVVQNARVVVPSPEALLRVLPDLASLLLMTDEQRIAYEHRLARQASLDMAPIIPASLPPPPELSRPAQPLPPPILISTARPPELGGVRVEDFDRLPGLPPQGIGTGVSVAIASKKEGPIKDRLLQVSLMVGDDLFRRGRFKEAFSHFELAYSLSPGREELMVRLDRCRPHLPPPPPRPPVVVQPPRQRLAIVNFVTYGDESLLPPGLGACAAENIAPYFCPPYEVVDRGEVFWYMGRLGMTLHDLMNDPGARRWLSRALNTRFFLLGTIRQGPALEVTTHLLDAECGCEIGSGRVRLRDPRELKLRLCELARLTLLDPRERDRFYQAGDRYDALLVEGRGHLERGDFALAIQILGNAQRNRPFSVEVQVLLDQANLRARQAAIEETRRREAEQARALAAEFQRRQLELARQAELARIRAEQEAAALAEAARRAQEEQRRRACDQLLVQARFALQTRNFSLSVELFESASGLRPHDDIFHEMAQARAQAESEARARTQAAEAQRAAEHRRQQEAQLAIVRAQAEEAHRQREAEEQARRKVQEARDRAAYTKLLDDAQRFQAQAKYDAAVEALQSARLIKNTDEVQRLLSQALTEQARATAEKKDAKTRADLEKRLAAEKVRREQAEEEARRNQELYNQALQAAEKAAAERQYDLATTRYQEAAKLYRTDVVLAGLRQVEEARARDEALARAEERKQAEEGRKKAEYQRLMSEGQSALAARQHARAVAAFKQASGLMPGNVDALAALSKAEQARDESAAADARKQEAAGRQAAIRRFLASGDANLKAKQFDAAAAAFSEALKLNPGDATAQAGLREAERARTTAAATAAQQAEAKKKREQYQKLMSDGRAALAAKQHDVAIRSFQEAQALLPGDQASAAFLKDAEKARTDAMAAVAAEARKREEEQQRKVDFTRLMNQANDAMANKKYDEAGKAYGQALLLQPNDPIALKGRREAAAAVEATRTPPRKPATPDKTGSATRPMPPTPPAPAKTDPPPAKPQADYNSLMQKAAGLEERKKFEEAVEAYGQALKLMPDDARAQAALKRAQFQQLMAEGQEAMKARRFPMAIKRFEEALKLVPDSAEARKALNQARQSR